MSSASRYSSSTIKILDGREALGSFCVRSVSFAPIQSTWSTWSTSTLSITAWGMEGLLCFARIWHDRYSTTFLDMPEACDPVDHHSTQQTTSHAPSVDECSRSKQDVDARTIEAVCSTCMRPSSSQIRRFRGNVENAPDRSGFITQRD